MIDSRDIPMLDINQQILDVIDANFSDVEIKNSKSRYEYNGSTVPRVTSIVKCASLNQESLMRWANHLGFKRQDYSKEMKKSAEKGTIIHNAVENYLLGKNDEPANVFSEEFQEYEIAKNNALQGFKKFWRSFKAAHKIKGFSLEGEVVTPWYGGTYDFLIEFPNGECTLYDFKSSNHVQFTHFVQLAAYKYALENFYNKKITKIGVLQLDKAHPACYEYLIDSAIEANQYFIMDCTNCFFSLLYSFYNLHQVNNGFNTQVVIRKDRK